MNFPDFFQNIPSLTLHDPLAQTLGAGDGIFTYNYSDAVKFAGHSCPTVTGAWLCVEKALKELYPDEIPTRGMLDVEIQSSEDEGVTGVIASIFTLITGAASIGGFKGLSGNFSRNNKLHFNAPITTQIKVTRLDTHASVSLNYDPSPIAPDPKQMPLMKKIISQTASKEEISEFGVLWQERVERIFNNKDEVLHIIS